jgi:hypothetical protein
MRHIAGQVKYSPRVGLDWIDAEFGARCIEPSPQCAHWQASVSVLIALGLIALSLIALSLIALSLIDWS